MLLNSIKVYLCSHYVPVWAVCDDRWLLSQLFWVHGLERSDGECIQKLSKKIHIHHMRALFGCFVGVLMFLHDFTYSIFLIWIAYISQGYESSYMLRVLL